jgi:uncharacterized protein
MHKKWNRHSLQAFGARGVRIAFKRSPGRGMGVFAAQKIPKGTLILEDPVVVLPKADWQAIASTLLNDYFFAWGEKEDYPAIPFGYGILLNHATGDQCNTRCEDNLPGCTMKWIALRDIEPGEELLYNYRGTGSDEPVWFKERAPVGPGRARRGKRKAASDRATG